MDYKEVTAMVQFRACPRCRGDMKSTRDMYGNYKECLQCGNMVDMPHDPKVRRQWAQPERKVRKKSAAA